MIKYEKTYQKIIWKKKKKNLIQTHKLIIVPTREITPVTHPKITIKIEYLFIFGLDFIELDYNFK